MRATMMLLALGLLTTAFTVAAPEAEAVGWCTAAEPDCDDLVCIGYTGGQWVDCYPRDIPIPCRYCAPP